MRNSIEAKPAPLSIASERHYGDDEPAFKGHFPMTKILPGVMLVGYALEVAEAYLRGLDEPRRLVEIVSAKFLAPVFPRHTVNCVCRFSPGPEGLEMKAVLSREGIECSVVKARYEEAR